MWHVTETWVSKCCWKNSANRLAWCRVATNLQSVKMQYLQSTILSSAIDNIHLCAHTHTHTHTHTHMLLLSRFSRVQLCDPIDGNPLGSSVPGIIQARILEWVAISFSDLITKSCLTLCDPMDHSPPGPSVHGISQARILKWVANPFSRGSSRPRDRP